ncbi:peptidyl-tRNA hydrolase ArfB [bacterium BMS3Bbin02]|nr:peptidyl-tRNA hydrolase ArfB [bacterium BMS3Bbin02]
MSKPVVDRARAYDCDMESLVVDGQYEIPATELDVTFSTSGGPGGQHANRSATRVVLSFDLEASAAFDDHLKATMRANLGQRFVNGRVVVTVDESRSQWRNRQIARARMRDLLTESLRLQTRRRPTQPTRASQRRRVDTKKARGQLKQLRSRPRHDDPS